MEWNKSILFDGINISAHSGAMAGVRQKRVYKAESLFFAGDKAHSVYVISSGQIKLTRETADGVESLILIAGPNDVLAENLIFDEENYSYSATALSDAEVFVIPLPELRSLKSSNPQLLVNASKILMERNKRLQAELEHIKVQNAPQRIGCYILEHCKKPKGSTKFELSHEKGVIASKLGMKPETFSRALSDLKEHGVNVEGKNVTVQNIESLSEFVCGACSNSFPCDK